jgi:hypothetical protein
VGNKLDDQVISWYIWTVVDSRTYSSVNKIVQEDMIRLSRCIQGMPKYRNEICTLQFVNTLIRQKCMIG